ncbi:iron transporter [Halobacteria archaeon AArc-m2/3/4]|uniref:Iron transporter n=1 Tax=Natronoglomus mannanivorans TaxID=2979990 RepID=A0ABT2Q910_9EURY|nr:iron transporter [Halobacteria archaeon AArc-m2/3/4]
MDRRSLLEAGLGCAVGVASAGCLEAFSSESAWRDLVVDRPDAVYVPAKIDEMTTYGTATVGPYGIAVTATRPHSFFTVTGSETTQVSHRSDDSIHLMVSLWDRATGEFVPSSVRTTVGRDEDVVDDRQLWPMLSQRMGVHYGDNVALPADGPYELSVRIDPPAVRTTGEFDGRFADAERATLSIDYAASEIDALERTLLDVDQRGGRGPSSRWVTGKGAEARAGTANMATTVPVDTAATRQPRPLHL